MPMHVSLILYIPSNNAGKNISTKTFNILDSEPVRSRVEGSSAFSRYPGRANFPYISMENSSNRFYAKHRLGSAGTKRVTRLAGLAFESRVTFLPGKMFAMLVHTLARLPGSTWLHVDSQSMREHSNWEIWWRHSRSLLELTKLCCTSTTVGSIIECLKK